jgi:hypothetical protein
MKRDSPIRRILCLLFFMVFAADVARADNDGEQPTMARVCYIFFGWPGIRIGNPDFDQQLVSINKTVSNAAIEKLSGLHYRIEPFFSEAREAKAALENLYRAIQQTHCDKGVELSQKLTQLSKPDSVPYLRFMVLVFHVERNAEDQSAKIVSDYRHDYSYELTKNAPDLGDLSLPSVGVRIAQGIDLAEALGVGR